MGNTIGLVIVLTFMVVCMIGVGLIIYDRESKHK